jgi:hypothetical protein
MIKDGLLSCHSKYNAKTMLVDSLEKNLKMDKIPAKDWYTANEKHFTDNFFG